MKKYKIEKITPTGDTDVPWLVFISSPEGGISYRTNGTKHEVIKKAQKFLDRWNNPANLNRMFKSLDAL